MGRLLGSAEKFNDKQVAETLAMLVEYGAKRGATDIHIEPHERFVLVRYRIDGALRGLHKLPRQALGTVMAELKRQAGLDAQEVESPQEGEYTALMGDDRTEIRLATMPVYGGEKAVLHLSSNPGDPVDLTELGFWGEGLRTLKSVLANPHGLITVAGPRHSGVSSTLFSLLKDLNSPLVNIATVETGAKHHLPGINQTYLPNGLSMQDGLRAVLNQDPNIIMVDNLPDGTTATLAVQAATTGHMVLAGLHAQDSAAALLRLRHAGVEPFLLLTGLRASVGQRLVRVLCPDCRERYQPDDEERAQLQAAFGLTTPTARKQLHQLEMAAAPVIFGDVRQLNSTPSQITHLWRPSQRGCEACGHSGYRGRTSLTEVLTNTDNLHKALLAREAMPLSSLQAAVLKDGFVPMRLDGLVKALRGQTTPSEVLRALSVQA